MAVAIGYRRREADAYGVDFSKRGARLDEFLQIVRKLWAGETVSFEGKHFMLKEASIMPLPPRGHVPLYIGGFADKALERVAKYGDGYFGNAEVCDLYIEQAAGAGKGSRNRADSSARACFSSSRRSREGHARTGAALSPCEQFVRRVAQRRQPWAAPSLEPMTLEQFKTSGILQILTPSQAIDKFKAMQARMPLEHVMMMLPPGLPSARFVEYAEVFANEVIPAFR